LYIIATTKMDKHQSDADFLESSMREAGFSSLESLADALDYSLRTLRGVKYGEVKLSRFLRAKIEKVVEERSGKTTNLYIPQVEETVVRETPFYASEFEFPEKLLAELKVFSSRYSIAPKDALRLIFDSFFNRLK